MTSFFKKHPNTMNPQELFDTLKLVQQNAKKQGQHHPMYTAKQPAPGTEAGPEHMHEQATRQQLTSLYEAENPPKAKTPEQPQQTPAPQQQEQQPQEQPQAPMGQQTAQNTTGGLMSDIIPSAYAEDRLAQAEIGVTPGITRGMTQGFKSSPDALISGIGIGLIDKAEVKFQIRQLADTKMDRAQFIEQYQPNDAALSIFDKRTEELKVLGK